MQRSVTIYEGESPIETIAVIALFRNNASYIPYFCSTFESIEKSYNMKFKYYFFENDSTDNTVELLENFMKNREGLFIHENLDLEFSAECDISYRRINRIASIRNLFLSKIRADILKSCWCLFVDSDIYFNVETIQDMFVSIPPDTCISMITCNTLDTYDKLNIDESTIPDDAKFVTTNHYYDTFAYVSLDNVMTYPICANKDCCHAVCITCENRYIQSGDIEYVRSAWGGFVLVKSSAFNFFPVHWKPLCLNDGNSLCEHIYFCDTIRFIFGEKSIVKMNNINIYRKEAKHCEAPQNQK